MQYISLIFGCLLSILIIYYLKNLETIGCKCALNYKRDYIFYYTCFALAIGVSNILFGTFARFQMIMMIVLVPYAIAGIVNLFMTISYIDEMKKINCNCSESIFRTLMYILAILNICILALTTLIFIFLFFMARHLFTNKNMKRLFKTTAKNASALN